MALTVSGPIGFPPGSGADVASAGDTGLPTSAGKVIYVDAENGSDTNSGLSAAAALATLDAALTLATDGAGDVILIYPGTYDENVVVDKDYVNFRGVVLGGYARPDVVPASGIPLTVTAQGFTSVHVRYAATGDDVVFQQGNGFLFEDNVFDGDGTADKGVRLVPDDTDDSLTASEGLMKDNLFRGCGVGLIFDAAAPPVGVGSTDNDIIENVFQANTIDIATAATGAGNYSVHTANISHNHFVDKNKTTYIDLTTANGGAASDQTGAIQNNWFAADAITADNQVKMVGTGFTFSGNFSTVGVVDGSGLD